MANDIRNLVKDVVAAPLGDIIASVGEGVAEAQAALDEGSLSKTLEIYSEAGDEGTKFLRDIGYRPTFYTLPETTGEVSIAMTLGNSTKGSSRSSKNLGRRVVTKGQPNRAVRSQMYATPVDGGYSNKFGFDATVATKLTFKIVPVPAPEGIDDIRVIPDLKGQTGQGAAELADQFNLDLVYTDKNGNDLANPKLSLLVKSQRPAAGEIGRAGDDIVVVL